MIQISHLQMSGILISLQKEQTIKSLESAELQHELEELG
jgi:hypothetical protein